MKNDYSFLNDLPDYTEEVYQAEQQQAETQKTARKPNDYSFLNDLPDYVEEGETAVQAPTASIPPIKAITPPHKPDPKRLEEFHAYILRSKTDDPEIKATLERNKDLAIKFDLYEYGQPEDHKSTYKAEIAQYITQELYGLEDGSEPSSYFIRRNKPMPNSTTKSDAWAAVYDDYAQDVEKNYNEIKQRKLNYKNNRDQLEIAVTNLTSGKWTPLDLDKHLTPEQKDIYTKEFDPKAISKANAAMIILQKNFAESPEKGLRTMIEQDGARQISSALSNIDQEGKYTINETAFDIFQTSLFRLMDEKNEEIGTDSHFLQNLRIALFSPILKRNEDFKDAAQAASAEDVKDKAGVLEFVSKLFGSEEGIAMAENVTEKQDEKLQELREKWLQNNKNDTQNARVLGLLSTAQDTGAKTSDKAHFAVKNLSLLGTMVGQTAPFFIPYAGTAIAFSGMFDDKRNRAYFAGLKEGTAEWSALIDAASSVAVEKIAYGAIGKFSRFGKLVNKLPANNAIRSKIMGNYGTRIITEASAGIIEESLIEPTAEALLQWSARNIIAPLADLNVGGDYKWETYFNELQEILKPEQLLATTLFVGGLTGLQSNTIKESCAIYTTQLEYLQLIGIDKKEAQRITLIKDPNERFEEANKARAEAWKDPAIAKQNLQEGASSFRDIDEARATWQSESYKHLQEQYNLPEIEENTDKQGSYQITTYDKITGEKIATQEVAEPQLLAMLETYIRHDEKQNIHEAQARIGANAILRSAEATGEIITQDINEWTKDKSLASLVNMVGSMGLKEFKYLAKLATAEHNKRTNAGMSEQESLSTPFAALSSTAPLGTLINLEQAFKERLATAETTTGEQNADSSRLFQLKTAPNSPANTLFMVSKGHANTREALEDILEWKLKNWVGNDPSKLQSVGKLLQDAQKEINSLGFNIQIIQPEGTRSDGEIIEAMSKLALSDIIQHADTLPIQQWTKDLIQYHTTALQDTYGLINIAQAYNTAKEKGTITQDLDTILSDLGHQVSSVFSNAKIEAEDIQAYANAQSIINRNDPNKTPTASDITQKQKQDAQTEKTHNTSKDKSKQLETHTETSDTSAKTNETELPPTLQNIFADGATYNPNANAYIGMLPVKKLNPSPEIKQVKVGANKKGIVNKLVGEYSPQAPPIYVWKRKNGTLEVISGRHRLDLAQRTNTEHISAYLYEESPTHNAQWAKLLDYEQNMQDDQADELTAAIYTRETKLSDAELTQRGLTRGGTKSARGILIGRAAHEDLWQRFSSGSIKAQDAEAICLLTQHIKDQERINSIQAQAASDIAKGKSLDHVASKIQLMNHAPKDGTMNQALISFGDSFEDAMEKAAEYITQSLAIINEHIHSIKGIRNISKKGNVLEKEGITAGLSSDPTQRLQELNLLKAMHEKCGLYENIRIKALTWDSKTTPDPIGDHLLDMKAERQVAEEQAALQEEEDNRKSIHALIPELSFSVTAHDQHGNTLHPETFITKKDGNINWLHLKKGKEWKPIRLRVGEDTAPHKGYGLTHILASRTLDNASFWNNVSPESYIEDICANASELYETGNRELIVKGKRPSQWMFIQLVDNGSFYSIVTAYPVRQELKPKGKRVPLRSEPASSVNVDQNSFPDSNANDTTPQSANAAWNSESNLPNGLPTVNIKNVTCTFDDGSTMQASFSIAPQEEQQWKKSLNNYLANGSTDRAIPIKMSSAPNVLKALGLSDRDIVITPSTLDKVMGGKHDLDRSHVERLAAAIHNPIMIIDSATQAEAIIVLTEIKTAEGNVIAAIHLDKRAHGGVYHVVASAYDGVSPWMIINQIKTGKLRYMDKKRALIWTRDNRLQLPARIPSSKGKPIVLTPEDVVKWKNAQNSQEASFSLTSMKQSVQSLLQPSMQATRAEALVKDFNQTAENWNRLLTGKEPSARIGAELLGTVNALISSARYILPKKYQTNLRIQMQWASVYAAMAENGITPLKGTLQGGDEFYQKFKQSLINQTSMAITEKEASDMLASIGTERLDRTMNKILEKIKSQLILYAKDEAWANTMKRVKYAYPKKEKGKKSPKGKMQTNAYRKLQSYMKMLMADQDTKRENMEALEAQYAQEEDQDKLDQLETSLLEWKTYGNYTDMSITQANLAMQSLSEYIITERNTWTQKLDTNKRKTKYQARSIIAKLPNENSATSRATAKLKQKTKLRELLKSLPYNTLSYSQLMLALFPVLGERFANARLAEQRDANVALLNASNDRSKWLYNTISSITGKTNESQCEQWLTQFNKPQETNIKITPKIKTTLNISTKEAKEWLHMSKEEREHKRQTLKQQEDKEEAIIDNIPTEDMIQDLQLAIEPDQTDDHIIRMSKQIPNKDAETTLNISRDCALYAILLHEQADYADRYNPQTDTLQREGILRKEGLDEKAIQQLYDYVGAEGLAYGYAMRNKLGEQGKTLAQVYEERMGIPFTLKENYFRASFDRNSTKEKDTLTTPNTPIGGGKYGLLIDRVNHNEAMDWSLSASLVYLASAAEQDNYIHTSHITTQWRSLLSDRILAQKLKQKLGDDLMQKLSSYLDLIDGASLENNRAYLNLSRMQSGLQKAFAYSVLAGNAYVVMKQASAIMHGFIAGYVPSAIIEKADGTKELAYRHIGMAEYLYHLARAKTGLGDITLKELKESKYFTARQRAEGSILAQIGNQLPGQNYSKLEKPAEKAMNIIEKTDVQANLHSMHALANAFYSAAQKENNKYNNPISNQKLKELALQQVGTALEIGAQPLLPTQKSIAQSGGGLLSKLAFVMTSEALNKLGLMIALWKKGDKTSAIQSWLTLGITNSIICWIIDTIKGDDDKDKWKQYIGSSLAGDITSVPIIGESVNYLVAQITGEQIFANSYAKTLIDIQGISRSIKKEYKHVSGSKEMDWDTHFRNLTSLTRAAGAGGYFARSTSQILSSYGALSLSAATGANISRASKDMLTKLTTEEKKNKKRN